MIPLEMEGETRRVGQPRDWNEERDGPCATLSIRDERIGGANYMMSGYMLTQSEMDVLVQRQAAGEPCIIRFAIRGENHPVILLPWVE